MANILHIDTDHVRSVAAQIYQASEEICNRLDHLCGAVRSIDWEGPGRDTFINQVSSIAHTLSGYAQDGQELGKRLRHESDQWESLAHFSGMRAGYDSRSTAGDGIYGMNPVPIPVPTPAAGGSGGTLPNLRDVIDFFDEIFKPIDWIGDHAGASKQFHEAMQQLGRWLNQIDGTKGYIKQFDSLAGVLEGSADAISGLGDLLALDDFNKYFNQQMTNQEIARTAINNTFGKIPIPFLGDQIADRLMPYLSDPNGKWKGLAPSVQ